jgi:hypothetical protein
VISITIAESGVGMLGSVTNHKYCWRKKFLKILLWRVSDPSIAVAGINARLNVHPHPNKLNKSMHEAVSVF